MKASVWKTEAGRDLVLARYRAHLDSSLGEGTERRFLDTSYGPTFTVGMAAPGKPPVVLLHGSASNSASWLGVLPLYARRLSAHCLDIPGEPGLSSPERLRLASDAPSRWLGECLDALGLERVAFVGMSLGGWYALDFAARHPERVSALSLFAAGGIAPQRIGFLFTALACLALGAKGRRLLARAIYRDAEIPEELLEYQALVSRHFRPLAEPLPIFPDSSLARLAMPLQYIAGEHDALLRAADSVARLEALLPGADARLVAGAGHAIIDRFGESEAFLAGALLA